MGGGFCGGFSDDGNAAVSASGDTSVVSALNEALATHFPLEQYPTLEIIAEPGRYFAEASAAAPTLPRRRARAALRASSS